MIAMNNIPIEDVPNAIGSRRAGTAHAIVSAVRARARLRAAWMERMWSFGETSPDQGLAITSAEVKSILTEPHMEAQRYQVFLAEDGPSRLNERAVAAEEVLDRDEFFRHLTQVFGLTAAERNLLCVLVAVELEPRLERVLAYLADDVRATRPTRAMVQDLFATADDAPETMAGLLRWRLATPLNGDRGWQARTQWQLDEAVLLSVAAGTWVDPALARAVRLVGPEDLRDLPCLYPEVLTQMLAEIPIPESEGGEACEVALTGPEGAGRETLAAEFAAARGRALVSVKTSLLIGEKGGLDALVPAVRLARAIGAEIYWRDAESVAPADWDVLRSLSGVSLRGAQMSPKSTTHRFVLRPLTTARRSEAWAHWSGAPVSEMVRTQRLTPAEIKLAAQAGDEVAEKAAMRRSIATEGELLHVLPCPYTWDDLVLPAQLRATLESLEAQVRLRWEVYEDWGFQRLTHLGQGISALFGGPSGTGKTMAAQVLARSLGLELYRVDLAGVVNKYIGETEKRLRDVFDACERSGALLFFDEADALFGSRMQVKDSHDRFANIEIDYLLQRIEQFDGIAILATNRKNDLDQAFLRRLRFVVDFLSPGEEERLQLWQKALPEHAPGGEIIRGEVDFALLAEELEVNGAQIKGIALGAAFLARNEKTTIGMKQILQAAQREYSKQNLRLRLPLGSVVAK